jgi:hypothetical protein
MTPILEIVALGGLIFLALLVVMGIYIKAAGTRSREDRDHDGTKSSIPRGPDGP